MAKPLKSIISYAIATALMLNIGAASGFAENTEETSETPLRIVCTSDLLMSPKNLQQAEESRLKLYNFCRELGKEGKLDAMLIGGDITSTQMPESMWNYCTKQLSQVLSEATDTALYITGNTDHYAGEGNGYSSSDYIGTAMKDRLGELNYWDVYNAEINGEEYPLAYRYYIGGYYFYFLNTAPNDMAGALRYGNFVYSQEAVTWIERKMQVDDPNGDSLIFLAAHFPLEGAGNESGAMQSTLSERLTDICAQHVNLIYLHSNSGVAGTDTAEKISNYNSEGLVLTDSVQEGIGLSSLWTFIPHSDGTYSIRNCKNGKYLNIEDGNKLRMTDAAVSWNVRITNGRVELLAADGVNGVRVPKSGTASFSMGRATPFELYVRSADSNGTVYTYSSIIEPGEDYVILSDSKYVMSSTVAGDGLKANSARVMGNLLVETDRKTASEGDASFTSVFMGSASTGNSGIQYLTVNIYDDRVEMALSNYSDGTITGLEPYTRFLNTKIAEDTQVGENKKPTVTDDFDAGLYLTVLLAAGIAGCAISGVATGLIKRKRFFE